MKKAKYIDSENIEIIDFDIFIMNINADFDKLIKDKKISDEDLRLLELNHDSNFENLKSLREEIEKERKSEIKRISDTYIDFIPCDKKELTEFSTRKIYYTKDAHNVYEHEIIIHNDSDKINEVIRELNQYLSKTDYIVIKCYEAKLSMLDAPYTQEYLDEVLNKRQAVRDKINELESLLKQ